VEVRDRPRRQHPVDEPERDRRRDRHQPGLGRERRTPV
jgi:hypothetical protein